MSLTIHTKTTLLHYELGKTKSQRDEILEIVAKYMQEHFEIIKASQFQDMSLVDILKEKPVVLFGECHCVDENRKYYGWIINQLHHDKAILLIEHPVQKKKGQLPEMYGQIEFVDPNTVKNIKCWNPENEEPDSRLIGLVGRHLYLQLNAIKRVIGMMKDMPTLSHVDFDDDLKDYIRNHSQETEYRELKEFFGSPGTPGKTDEKFNRFWNIMIKLIDNRDKKYLQPIIRKTMEQDDSLLWHSIRQEQALGFQPFVIAGSNHIRNMGMVLNNLTNTQIPFIRCDPKLKYSEDYIVQKIMNELRRTSTAPLVDVLEQHIIEKHSTSFSPTGPMSLYNLDSVLKKYCELKLAAHKNHQL